MKISLSTPHCRIIGVIIFLCGAINLVLYSSATFSVHTRTVDHRDTILTVKEDTSLDDATNNRIFLKSRRPHDKFKANKVLGGKNKFLDGKDKVLRVKSRKPKESKRNSSSRMDKGNVEHSSHSRHNLDEKDGYLKRVDGDAGKPLQPSRSVNNTSAVLQLNKTKQQITSTKTRVSTSRKSSDGFDIEIVLQLFKGCTSEEGEVSIDCFNDAYEELSKFFRPLGTIFSFVISEIQEKINILRDYRKDPAVGEHFQTIQSMIQYEVDHHLTVQDDKPSGSRTLLRLHRALEFISALVAKIKDGDSSGKFSTDAMEAYDNTLARYHPWLMKKAVHMAMYALPDRRDLLATLKMPDSPDTLAKFQALTAQLDDIYQVTQELYAANKLLDLP